MKLRVQIFNNKIIPNVDDLRQIGVYLKLFHKADIQLEQCDNNSMPAEVLHFPQDNILFYILEFMPSYKTVLNTYLKDCTITGDEELVRLFKQSFKLEPAVSLESQSIPQTPKQFQSNSPAPTPSCVTHIQLFCNIPQPPDVLLKFNAALRALEDQMGLLSPDSNRFTSASPTEQEKLRNVKTSITFLLEKLNSYRQDFYDDFDCEGNDVDLLTFKHKCLTLLNDEECNILFNEPRGDWSVGRILGELIRSLKSLVFSDAKAPRFFTTTTQDKVNKLVDSVNELGISRP